MPILVACSCGVTLKAPDAAAGFHVRCRNCQAVVPVPAIVDAEAMSDFEYVDPATVAALKPVAPKPVAARPVPAKPGAAAAVPVKAKSKPVIEEDEDEAPRPKKKSKAVIDEDDEEALRKSKKKMAIIADDDEEDDDEEAPRKSRKKGKKAAKKQTNPLIFVLGGVGALFAVGFIGVMVWYVAIREKGSTAGTIAIPTAGTVGPVQPPPGPVVPAGWTRYEQPEFSVTMLDSIGHPNYDFFPGEKAIVIFFAENRDQKQTMGVAVEKMTPSQNALALANPERALDDFEKEDPQYSMSKILSRKDVMGEGHKGRELKVEMNNSKLFARIFLAHGYRYSFIVHVFGAVAWPSVEEMGRVFFDCARIKTTNKIGSGGSPPAPVKPPMPPQKFPDGWTKYEYKTFASYFKDSLGKPVENEDQYSYSVRANVIGSGRNPPSIVVRVENIEPGTFQLHLKRAEKEFDEPNRFDLPSHKTLSRKNVGFDKIPGREYKFEDTERGEVGYTRTYYAYNRRYVFSVTGSEWATIDELAKHFFENLKLKP